MADAKSPAAAATATATETKSWTGSCLCTKIKLSVTGPPLYVGFCHCSICARLGGTDRVLMAGWSKSGFTITAGQSELKSYNSGASGATTRYFCKNCGCTVYTEPAVTTTSGAAPFVNASPTLFADEASTASGSYRIPLELKPTAHSYYGSSCLFGTGLKNNDGLPTFKTAAKEMGGPGEPIKD